MAVDYAKYLRMDKMPLYWCPGCGDGIVLKCYLEAIDELGWSKDDCAMVSGIGCAARVTGYVDFHTLHTIHGRAIAVAVGIKMAHPDKHVFVFGGDGDLVHIGGNHLLHACRRNIDITVVLINNWIYGMTGGQHSCTTPPGAKASTAPRGSYEPTIDVCKMAIGAGAGYVARGFAGDPVRLKKLIKEGLEYKGFALIDVFSPCPINFGRRNKLGDPAKLLEHMKSFLVSSAKAKRMSEEELKGKFITGVLHKDESKPELTEAYKGLVEKAQASDEYWAKYAKGTLTDADKYKITREELKKLYPYDVETPLKEWKKL